LEGIEKGFFGFEVGRVEPLDEPVLDRLEERRGVGGPAPIVQQPRKAHGSAQFPGQGALPA